MSHLDVVVAQIRPRKGDYAENLRRIGSVFTEVAGQERPPDLVVFPETVLSGYFVEGGVAEVALPVGAVFRDLAEQHRLSGAPALDVVVGFYEVHRNRFYNAAVYATLGGPDAAVVHVHRKIFLPTYGLFDEQRFVQRGKTIQAFPTRFGRVAMAVCEDAWHSIVPTIAALQGAQLVVVPSAAPGRGAEPDPDRGADDRARPASVRRWERLVRRIAEEHGVYVVLAQLVGFEGGKGFPGSSVIVDPRGEIMVRGPLFESGLVQASLSFDEITRARAQLPLLADLETQLPALLASAEYDGPPEPALDSSSRAPGRARAPRPARPLEIDPVLLAEWLVAFLQDEVGRRRGFDRVLVGLSGGVDSATTAALAVRAFGPSGVLGVRMPYRTSSTESLEHAAAIAEELGIAIRTIDISAAVDGFVAAVDPEMNATRKGNVMARTRMITLFDLSAKEQALPLGTGNKTERLLGYFTWHADDSPPVNPLGDLFKSQVRQLARHLRVPDAILEKPATADLEPGQTDEGDLGVSYERADQILHWILVGISNEEMVSFGFTPEEIRLVQGRLGGTHWKRHLPTTAVVSGSAIRESYLRPVDY
ncbi:MAG TPA: NAD+ synthase [Gemmatimonadales bacterium]